MSTSFPCDFGVSALPFRAGHHPAEERRPAREGLRMTGRWNRTAVVGVAVGAFVAGAVIAHRPATVAAERNEKAESGSRVGYVLIQRVLWESARSKAHGKALAELRKKVDDRLAEMHEKPGPVPRGLPPVSLPTERPDAAEGGREAKLVSNTEGDARREFDAHADRLLGEMYKEVAIVSAQLARELGLDAVQTYPIAPGTIDLQQQKGVLTAPSALLYVRRDADLTDEVIRRLDKRYEAEVGVSEE